MGVDFDLTAVLEGGSKSRITKAFLDAENSLSPLEFLAAARESIHLNPSAIDVLQERHLFQLLAIDVPSSHRRSEIGPDITLFADPNSSRFDKALIFAFCGSAHRLMMSVSVFLQLLPKNAFDVVVLRDISRTHYLNSREQYADDFAQLVGRLAQDLQAHRYRKVFCYGTSMGGFPALRCGLVLGGARAISVCGCFPLHARPLLHTAYSMPAFEMLCSCRNSLPSDFVCVYGEHSVRDVRAADHLGSIFPIRRWPVAGVSDHNVIYEMWKQGTLRTFYRELFSDRHVGFGD
jgi:hypothetical protein